MFSYQLFSLLIGVCIFIFSWVLGTFLQNRILSAKNPKGYSTLFLSLTALISKIGCVSIGTLILVSTLGIDVGSLMKALAFVGFALSFILKDLLADFVSGFFILISKTFTIGQELIVSLEKNSYQGKVTSIDIRYTTLENPTQTILVPNSTLFKQPICILKK